MKNQWEQFSNLEKAISIFLIINIFLDLLNKYLFRSIIPNDIITYSFWLSLGLFLGFKLCKFYFSKAIKKNTTEPKMKNNIT